MSQPVITAEQEQAQDERAQRAVRPGPVRTSWPLHVMEEAEPDPTGAEPDFHANCRIAAQFQL